MHCLSQKLRIDISWRPLKPLKKWRSYLFLPFMDERKEALGFGIIAMIPPAVLQHRYLAASPQENSPGVALGCQLQSV